MSEEIKESEGKETQVEEKAPPSQPKSRRKNRAKAKEVMAVAATMSGSTGVVARVKKREVVGDVVNKSNRPRQLVINGRWEVVPAKGKITKIKKSLVGKLPKSVFFVARG